MSVSLAASALLSCHYRKHGMDCDATFLGLMTWIVLPTCFFWMLWAWIVFTRRAA